MQHSRASARADWLWAISIGVLALILYVATLQPDVGGPEDTPKFQFLGYVLGTAHPPGYPLYVMLSHVFVQLPVGSIAYRANLFSAVMAAVCCALTYTIARQIGAGRIASFCVAAALATGLSFWTYAVFAEVYSLAAVLVALTVALLLSWGSRGGAARLLAAVAALSAGLGNHLTIVGLAPAAALYVLIRNRRALDARVLTAAAAVLVLGFAQYGFILLRTHQGAPFLESRARNVSELVDVVTAKRFAKDRFAFGPSALVTIQLPAVASAVGAELGAAGGALLVIGLGAAAVGRLASVALVAGSALGLFAMVLNLSGDVAGFITPAMPLVWALCALGIDAVARMLRWTPPVGAPLAAAATVAAALIPGTHLVNNYAQADQSANTGDGRFLRGFFSQLPDRAAVVGENYLIESVLEYLLLTGEAGPTRGIVRLGYSQRSVLDAARDGRRVFAFGGAASFLTTEGLLFERFPMAGSPLDDWLRALPRGSVILGAANESLPVELFAMLRPSARATARARPFVVFAAVQGRPDLFWREDDRLATLPVDATLLASARFKTPGSLVVTADERAARIELASAPVSETAAGVALSVFTRDGILSSAFDVPAGSAARAPLGGAVYEFVGNAPCVQVSEDGWADISQVLTTGSWVTTVPSFGSVVLESELPGARRGRVAAREVLRGTPIRVEDVPSGDDGQMVTAEFVRARNSRPLFRVALDSPRAAGRARLRPGGAVRSLSLCQHMPPDLFRHAAQDAILTPDLESEAYFGWGWGPSERIPAGRVRRGESGATLLLPLDTGVDARLVLDVSLEPQAPLELHFNGTPVGTCDGPAKTPCAVTLPAARARLGINALSFSWPSAANVPDGKPALTFHRGRMQRLPPPPPR
jgi:hypothetical protein